MKNVLEWLENSASQFGDKTVYSCESNSITFSALENSAKRIGSGILATTIVERTPIAVALGKDTFTIASFWVLCIRAGLMLLLILMFPKTDF